MKLVDYIAPVLLIIVCIIVNIIWGCHLDILVSILAAVIILTTVIVGIVQDKKIKALEEQR